MKRNGLGREGAEKLQRVYIKYRSFLFRNVAFPILNEHALSEDAVQETFARLIGNEHKIDESDERKTKNFLATVCKHATIDIYNKQKKPQQNVMLLEEFDALQNHQSDLLSEYIEKEQRDLLIAKAKTLDPKYQSVFFMRFTHDCSYEEIAAILKLEQATVRKRVERLQGKLINLLEKEAQ